MGEQDQSQEQRTRRSALQSILGLSVVSISAIVYDRMARTPDWNSFEIQIGSIPNAVDLRGTVPVTLLSSPEDNFRPAEEIDLANVTVRFAIYRGALHPGNAALFDQGASPRHGDGTVEDVNSDGIDDLTFHFDACDALVSGIREGDMKGRLLLKEKWSFTEEKDGWEGDNPIRISQGNCS